VILLPQLDKIRIRLGPSGPQDPYRDYLIPDHFFLRKKILGSLYRHFLHTCTMGQPFSAIVLFFLYLQSFGSGSLSGTGTRLHSVPLLAILLLDPKAAFRNRIGCSADPDSDPAFYLNGDPDPDPDPDQTCRHKKLDFDLKKIFYAGNTVGHKHTFVGKKSF
jgi:hypothetical protein